jgi:hypothetical protein
VTNMHSDGLIPDRVKADSIRRLVKPAKHTIRMPSMTASFCDINGIDDLVYFVCR